MRLMVARVKPTRAAIAPCLMPSRASANTSCLIPIGVGRGIVRTIRKTFEKICKYWFKVVTVWRLIWGNDHLYCGFGARRSHLTLHWMSAHGSVGFRWGTITGPYHANFSQVETQKFDPHWFYCLQWGCNNPFLPRVYWFVLHIYQWSFVMGWQSIFPMNNQYVLYVVSLITLQRWSLRHGDVIKWKHFPRYWPYIRGIHRSPVNSPHKGQWRGALMFTLICARINGWVNNCEAGDLWRHRNGYDMIIGSTSRQNPISNVVMVVLDCP